MGAGVSVFEVGIFVMLFPSAMMLVQVSLSNSTPGFLSSLFATYVLLIILMLLAWVM